MSFFIALLLFSGLTVVYMNYYKPYEVVGGELLKNPGFENGFEGWGTSGLNSVESDLPGIVALYAMESGQNIFKTKESESFLVSSFYVSQEKLKQTLWPKEKRVGKEVV